MKCGIILVFAFLIFCYISGNVECKKEKLKNKSSKGEQDIFKEITTGLGKCIKKDKGFKKCLTNIKAQEKIIEKHDKTTQKLFKKFSKDVKECLKLNKNSKTKAKKDKNKKKKKSTRPKRADRPPNEQGCGDDIWYNLHLLAASASERQALALRRGRPITAPTYIPILGITDQTERNRICNRAASARFRQNQRQRDQELQTCVQTEEERNVRLREEVERLEQEIANIKRQMQDQNIPIPSTQRSK